MTAGGESTIASYLLRLVAKRDDLTPSMRTLIETIGAKLVPAMSALPPADHCAVLLGALWDAERRAAVRTGAAAVERAAAAARAAEYDAQVARAGAKARRRGKTAKRGAR